MRRRPGDRAGRHTTPGLALTSQQRRVPQRLSRRNTSAQIAGVLSISTSPVIPHRKNLMKRLGLHSTAELIRFAVEHHLIDD